MLSDLGWSDLITIESNEICVDNDYYLENGRLKLQNCMKAMLGAENCTMTFSDSRPHSMMDKIPKAPSSPPPAWDQGFDCIIAIPFFLGLSASIWAQRGKKYSKALFSRFSLGPNDFQLQSQKG